MAFLIGTDEAGYGPSLGPLVISASGFSGDQLESDLYLRLAETVTDSPQRKRKSASQPKLLIADSKVACRGGSVGRLERSVMVALKSIHGRIPRSLAELVAMVGTQDDQDSLTDHFWMEGEDLALPLASEEATDNSDWEADITEMEERFTNACQSADVKLTHLRSTILQPPSFNAGVIEYGNKASLLSDSTLKLIAELIEGRSEDLLIECDKHGGRNYYLPVIAQTLTDSPVKISVESPEQSVYQWQRGDHTASIRFAAKGEGQLPVALASMVSKYVREVFMHRWNIFWRSQVANLKPTKGYPQDAKRFLAEIEELVAANGYPQEQFWRSC